MTAMPAGQSAEMLLSIGWRTPDGGLVNQSWRIAPAAARRLARKLGPPSRESVTTAETGQECRRILDNMPGYLEVRYDGAGNAPA